MNLIPISEWKNIFDPKLDDFLSKKIKRIEKYQSQNPFLYDIILHTTKVIKNGGKRVRPYMAYLGAMMTGNVTTQKDLDLVLEAIVGLELFHNFALIHDDVIDRGHERHGAETVHNFVRNSLKKSVVQKIGSEDLPSSEISKINHNGDSQAILVGDLVFAWSKEALYSNCKDGKSLERLRDIFSEMVEDVMVGQMFDVSFMIKEKVSNNELETKNLLKTARYSFVHPLKIGDAIANGKGENDSFYEKFGQDFGIAYQIQDDLLDIIGDPAKTGKDNLLDLADGQHTYFTQYIFENGSDSQKEILVSLFGKKLNEDEKEKAKKLFVDSGAIQVVGANIEKRINESDQSIKAFGLKSPFDTAFHQIVEVLRARVS